MLCTRIQKPLRTWPGQRLLAARSQARLADEIAAGRVGLWDAADELTRRPTARTSMIVGSASRPACPVCSPAGWSGMPGRWCSAAVIELQPFT